MAALPNDMRSVLRLWSRWVDNKGNASGTDANITACIDAGISLLTEFEIFGSITYANQYEQNHQKQMQYYTAGNSKIRYKHNATTTKVHYFTSSPVSTGGDRFCLVWSEGYASIGHAYSSSGLTPVFKV